MKVCQAETVRGLHRFACTKPLGHTDPWHEGPEVGGIDADGAWPFTAVEYRAGYERLRAEVARLETALRERDEARAEVERLRKVLGLAASAITSVGGGLRGGSE